ncbi:MAG: amino acid ABC transporter substrate-binding protein, partial [Rhodospirillales bacterium]|nr:amino acid ABC transporter substrate-binding protein [Rhodospirillales bacterium]
GSMEPTDGGAAGREAGMGRRITVLAALWVWVMAASVPAGAGVLDDVRQRGALRCGANPIVGYAIPNESGKWVGFNVDFCRALAAAIFKDAERFEVVPVESKTRFRALANGTVDLLVDGTTWTLERDVTMGFSFAGVWLYDGQGFLAKKSLGIRSMKEAGEASVCVADGTTSRRNVEDYLRAYDLKAKVVVVQSDEGAWTSFLKGRCDIITNDRFGLIMRSVLHSADARQYALLPEMISKEPLGPVVRAGDDRWFKLVRWVLSALIAAEERGLSARRVVAVPADADTELRILSGQGDDHAEHLGLEPGWARRAIEQVGHYGEIFDRHFGAHSPLKAERGVNALWNRGGLMYAPPFK